jgi:predicted nucleic acid-binding protein
VGRTQVYLGQEELGLLDRVAAETGASRSELIRRAIRTTFGQELQEARLEAIRQSAGSWKRRRFSGAEYVDALPGDLSDRLRRGRPRVKFVDTTLAVDHLRGTPEATGLLAGLISRGETLVASEITRFELLAGVRRSELRAPEAFFSSLAWAPVDGEVTRTAGTLAQRLRRSHSGIDDADYLIAATAMVLDAELLTTNVRHFPMIERLRPPY